MKYSGLEKSLFGLYIVVIIISIAIPFVPNLLLYVG